MARLFAEVGFAVRSLRKSFGFAAVTTLTIALGIGACAAIFSVVNAVLLQPLPYSDPERLVLIWGELRARSVKDWLFAPPDFRDLRLQSTAVFEDVAGLTPSGRVPIGDASGEPEQVRAAAATPNLFRVLGARVQIGRDFAEDDGTPQAQAQAGQPAPPRLPAIVILSHGFWQRRYGGDPAVVGRQIDFGNGGGRAEIVGVLQPGFEILLPPRVNMERIPDIWSAIRIDYENASRNNVAFRVIARLRPDATSQAAQAQVDRVAADLRQVFPLKQTSGLYFNVVPMYDDLVGGVRPAIVSLMGAVGFVLLIACANVANLLVVRASARGRELAVRAAIGASRFELMRHMLAESLVVAGIGTVLGVALAHLGVRLLLLLGPQGMPRLETIGIDPRVLGFAVAAGLLTALLCGIVPALRVAGTEAIEALRATGGRSSGLRSGGRFRSAMVVTEVALSFILLVGAGLTVRSFAALARVDPGFDPRNLLTFSLPAPFPEAEQRANFKRQLRTRLLAIPGVESVTAAGPLPLDGGTSSGRWGTEAAASDPSAFRQATFHFVLPGYFEAMKTRLIEGRTFTDADNDVPAARGVRQLVIDDILAQKAFPGQSAVGKTLLSRITTPEAERFEVIGVVKHQRHTGLASDGPEAIFILDTLVGHGAATRWAVRSSLGADRLGASVRAAVTELAPRAAIAEMQPMQAFVDRAMAPLKFATTLIGIFAAVAVALAGIGLYGVLSTIVSQRTGEIGMRMVFGAGRGSIFGLVVGEGLKLAAAGVLVGLAGALAVTRVMASLLVGITPTDPPTFAAITALFFAIAALACWVPAFRASRLEPLDAIREE